MNEWREKYDTHEKILTRYFSLNDASTYGLKCLEVNLLHCIKIAHLVVSYKRRRRYYELPLILLSADIDISVVVKLLKREYNRRAEFSPLLWSKGTKLQLAEVYTRLRVVYRRKAGTSEIDVDDIFRSSEEDYDPLVLVEGSPRIGKTTFCLKLAHDWANGAMPRNFPIFKLVFLLKCRDMEGDIAKDVVEEIFEQLLPEDLREKIKEALVNFLEDEDNQKQILIILDGLDELPEKSGDRVNKVLDRKKLSFCYVLATTRQEKGIYTREQFKFDLCLAIEGFSEDHSFEYIRKHFRNIGTEHSSRGERLIQEVKRNPLLGHLQTNPLNLLLLCVVYQDHEGSLPSSITDLYQTIVRCLLRRYCVKEKLKASEEDEDLDKQFQIAILALGELAWKCLLNGRLSFYEDELAELERSNENIVARRLGLVYKEESLKRLKPRHAYSFLHKTFQEYLAASYIAHKLRRSKFYVLEEVQFSQVEGEFRQVFLFVCGILREKASILFKQIGDTLQKEWDWSKCSREAASFFTDSWEESGNAERMANTLCSFLPFPRVLHVSEYHYEDLMNVLEACAGFSKVQTSAEVHVAIPYDVDDVEIHKNIQRVLAAVTNVKTLTLPAVRYSVDRAKLSEVLRASKTLEKVTFALSGRLGDGWASALDVGLGADSSMSSVGLRIDGMLNQSSLQAVESLLFNNCLSSLSVTVCGYVYESLAEALARSLAGKSAVKFLDLCVNGKLSRYGASSLEEGILRNKSMRSVKFSVNGELPVNWQRVVENLHTHMAEKGIVSSIYPNTFSKVTDSQVTHLNWFLSKTDSVQQNVTLNVWGELSVDGCKAVCEVLLHAPVSQLTLNIHGQLTDEILRCTARCVKEQEKLSSITINTWAQMTEKERTLIKELGLDKHRSVSVFWWGTSAPLKESTESRVISSDEPQPLIASSEKAKKEINLTKELGLEKNPSVSLNVWRIDRSSWVSVESNGLSFDEEQDLCRTFQKIKKLYKSLSFTINLLPVTLDFWIDRLDEILAKFPSLKSLTLVINHYRNKSSPWGYELGECLAKRTLVNSLTLAINNYYDTSWFSGYELGVGLAKITSLNSLTLAINDYSDSNSLRDYELREGLTKSKSLTECNLIVNICGKC